MISKKLVVTGIVQAVGFRPFVYNLAKKYDIFGYVNNDANGVNIEIYAKKESFELFLDELKNNPPPLALINSIKIEDSNKKFDDFKIEFSTSSNDIKALIPSDIAICKDCVDDILDKNNFRFNYALTNCINCGPRYSIINSIPYDRKATSLKDFHLCKDCKQEFEDITNRRYHAQAISCQKCGPTIFLYDKNQNLKYLHIEAINEVAKQIEAGKVLAIKGMGGFHLVCDSTNNKAIQKIREFKKREFKPLAVMFKDIKNLSLYATFSKIEEEILTSSQRPIVLLQKAKDFKLSKLIAPNISKIGSFLPNTAFYLLLFEKLKNPIIATSANLKGEPIITSKDEVFEKLGSLVDFVLDYNRDIVNSCDDSIVQVFKTKTIKLRNSRGYAPQICSFNSKFDKKILAFGANQKATITLAFDNIAITSPYLGDLDSLASIEHFKKTLKHFQNFYNFKPDIIVCDKHEAYESVKIAKEYSLNNKIELIQIQHHYAHVLGVMAEYNLKNDVLAFVFDGTGLGEDNNIWGGEVFIANKKEYKRVNHFKYFKLLGSSLAIKEPRRVALSLLFDNFSYEDILKLDLKLLKTFSTQELKTLYNMWQKNLNSPLTSSVGRLFDVISSFADILHFQEYEGQSGVLIESFFDENIKDCYQYSLSEDEIDISLMIKEIIFEKDKTLMASKFINTLIAIIVDIAKKHSFDVVLCGGVFQNRVLVDLLIDEFSKNSIKFYIGQKYSPNDEAISLGQVYSQII